MKKIAILNPYLDVAGGGEKHILSIARVFEEYGYRVDLLWDDPHILDDLKEKLHIVFHQAHVVPAFTSLSPISRIVKTKEYQHFFYVTDGSYFFSLARRNYIFSMYPQKSLYQPTFLNRLKWRQWDFISNSAYTKQHIDQWTGKKSTVIHPCIDIYPLETIHNLKKDKIIVTVGRFFKHLHAKRQDIMIQAFQQLQQKNPSFKEFKLYLIGGLKEEDKKYFDELVTLAGEDTNIIFLPNAPYETVVTYYKKALFYWHAAGYGVDELKHPEAVEHLGMTPLEAMAHGCVVFCHESGGPKNMITDGVNGFLYDTIEELVDKTTRIYIDTNGMNSIRYQACKQVKNNFEYNVFRKKIISHFHLKQL